MVFRENATIYSADQQIIGHLKNFIFAGKRDEVTHLIISQDLPFTEDRVIPISLVDFTLLDRVYLRYDAEQLSCPNWMIVENSDAQKATAGK